MRAGRRVVIDGEGTGRQSDCRRRAFLRLLVVPGIVALTGCRSVLGGGKRDRVVDRYQQGVNAYNAGVGAHNDGVVAYRSDDNEVAARHLDTAVDRLTTALDAFRDADAIATELGNERAMELCRQAVDTSRRLAEASDLLAQSARAFLNDDPERAQKLYDDYRSLEATNADLPATGQIAEAVEGPFGL